ncbi:MAG: hypothetical protein ABT11_06915 [Novosphingobium sp. SCN 66-18]|nr:MAG: hypothetical protein ABT11_06915 [Novosphingobium sp. SCN 66-18]
MLFHPVKAPSWLPDVRHVAWPAPRCKEDHVNSHDVPGPGEARRDGFGGARHALQAAGIDGEVERFAAAPPFDLDESQRTPAPRHDIHLAYADPLTPGENAPAFEAQPQAGQCLATPALLFGHSPITGAAHALSAIACA